MAKDPRPIQEQMRQWVEDLIQQFQIIDGALDSIAVTMADMALVLSFLESGSPDVARRARSAIRAVLAKIGEEAGEVKEGGDATGTEAEGSRELGNDG